MSDERSRAVTLTLAGILVLGAVLRIVEFLHNRSFWVDEAMLALSIGTRSFAELVRPLSYDQTAPVLFLWLVKASSLIGGMEEPVLRIVPLIAGLLTPWVVWRAARAMAGPDVGLIAAALAATSPALVYFAAELKPYGLDALVTATLILVTIRVRQAPESAAAWWTLGLAGLLAFPLSVPAPLVLAGTPVALLADPRVRASTGARRRLPGMLAAWTIGGLAVYWFTYRSTATNPFMLSFWGGTFLDPRAPDFSLRLWTMIRSLVSPLPEATDLLRIRGWIAVGGVGVILLFRRGGAAALSQVGVPYLALVLASALGGYAIASRLVVFLAPLLFVLIGVVMADLLRLVRLRDPAVGVVGTLAALGWAAPIMIRRARSPMVLEDGRESARHILRTNPAEPVYIMPGGLPAWGYYSTDWKRPDLARLEVFDRASLARRRGALNNIVTPESAELEEKLLTYRDGNRVDLIGRGAGLRYREPYGLERETPDPDWAPGEVARMVSLGAPTMWVYGTHWTVQLLPALREEFASHGIVVTDSMMERKAVALRLGIPVSGASGPPSRIVPR